MSFEWTPEDDETLCRMRLSGDGFDVIARFLGRTEAACGSRFRKLRRGEVVSGAVRRGEIESGMGRQSQFWTQEEDEAICDACRQRLPLASVAARIGRSEGACRARAAFLGISETRLPPRPTPDCVSIRRCHDCGRPTTDYRCSSCRAQFRRKHGVSEFWNDEEGL